MQNKVELTQIINQNINKNFSFDKYNKIDKSSSNAYSIGSINVYYNFYMIENEIQKNQSLY